MAACRRLEVRGKVTRLSFCFQPLALHVPDHSDNREPLLIRGHLDALAERTLAGPVATGQGLVDNGHCGRPCDVSLGEITAFEERDPGRTKVIRADGILVGPLNLRPPFDGDACAAPTRSDRKRAGCAG